MQVRCIIIHIASFSKEERFSGGEGLPGIATCQMRYSRLNNSQFEGSVENYQDYLSLAVQFAPRLCVSVVEQEIKARPCLQVMGGRWDLLLKHMGSVGKPRENSQVRAEGAPTAQGSGILWGCRSYWLLAVTGHGSTIREWSFTDLPVIETRNNPELIQNLKSLGDSRMRNAHLPLVCGSYIHMNTKRDGNSKN